MGKKGTRMDKIREIIRLSQEPKTAVNYYVSEFRATGLRYQDIADLTDSKLSELISQNKRGCQKYKRLEAMFSYFARELKRKGVTLKLLWDEYIADNPDGYSYARAGIKDYHAHGT